MLNFGASKPRVKGGPPGSAAGVFNTMMFIFCNTLCGPEFGIVLPLNNCLIN